LTRDPIAYAADPGRTTRRPISKIDLNRSGANDLSKDEGECSRKHMDTDALTRTVLFQATAESITIGVQRSGSER